MSAAGMRVILCDEQNENVKVYVRAEMLDGCLRISGQDIGIAVKGSFGKNEYEYFYSFDLVNTDRLLSLLTDNNISIETALVSRFGGVEGCKRLREFCAENSIKYQFFTYS